MRSCFFSGIDSLDGEENGAFDFDELYDYDEEGSGGVWGKFEFSYYVM